MFALWLKTDGPSRLARRTPRTDRGLHRAVAMLAETTPLSTPAIVTRREDTRNTLFEPNSFEDLLSKINAVYKRYRGDRPTNAERKKSLDALAVWERWLDEEVDGMLTPPSNLAELRSRLQHLRLDLLKSGGF